jgi:hypothetical protein
MFVINGFLLIYSEKNYLNLGFFCDALSSTCVLQRLAVRKVFFECVTLKVKRIFRVFAQKVCSKDLTT